MKCPECQFDNREGVKFCEECGAKFELECPACKANIPLGRKFCGECGYDLHATKKPFYEISDNESLPLHRTTEKPSSDVAPIVGERKHITALFSDLTGYTAMSEKLDPEEVKEITIRIFGEISKIVAKYDGFIEKYAGDAVMALFGAPRAHEDDPIRAIKVARKIHELVDSLSPEIENRIGKPISMHTGINTGLVITGEVDMERGTHGVTGDTINLASRLSNLAKPGEILIGPATYRQAEGHFTFKSLESTMVKGKAEPVQAHKVLFPKEKPITIHRLSGLRADLIGRKVEIVELEEAFKNLREGKGRIFSICGDAGTGKSRLVDEFKATLNLKEVQWIEGHAYAYTQNIPYFSMIDLLNRVLKIKEDDPPEKVREKVESGIEQLTGKKEDFALYVGGLYSLSYSEVEEVSPEFWRSRLIKAIIAILSALAKRAPTIFFLEDLHWADPSFVELLRRAFLEIRQPAIVLCAYRPTFSLFTNHQVSGIDTIYNEIRLQDLSASEAQDMLESLLKTDAIPSDLKRFFHDKAEGNPFYLEEMVNSLIESKTLIRDNGSWTITKPISEPEISSTIHGVISGRLDRLEIETKRILQEASVIGRAFLYEILKRITELKQDIDRCLRDLEQFDLIRAKSLLPELEYVFKHALTQEVVYNGLLKKNRREIHEQIALVMEQLFHDRLPEFYETLSFHFRQGKSLYKAVDYLIKSGGKCLGRYSFEEAHQYYRQAFDILTAKVDKSKEKVVTLIDLLNSWAYVYYYLGDFNELTELLESNQDLAESLNDEGRLGMFYVWLGVTYYMSGRIKESYELLLKAKDLGEKCDNLKVVAYACTWLTWTCSELGLFDEGIGYGERAKHIAKSFPADQYLFFKSLAGLGHISILKGDLRNAFKLGKLLLEYGKEKANNRSEVMGHYLMCAGHSFNGDYQSSIACGRKSVEVARDPSYSQFPKTFLVYAHLMIGKFGKARDIIKELIAYCEQHGFRLLLPWANLFLGAALIGDGHMTKGLRMIKKARQAIIEDQRSFALATAEFLLAEVFSQISTGPSPSLSVITKNIVFLVRNVPFASKNAEKHFNNAITLSKKINAFALIGPAYYSLGIFYKEKKRRDKAIECIYNAVQIFEKCGAEAYLKQAKEVLTSLG